MGGIDSGIKDSYGNAVSRHRQPRIVTRQRLITRNPVLAGERPCFMGKEADRLIGIDGADVGRGRNSSDLLPRSVYHYNWQAMKDRAADDALGAPEIEILLTRHAIVSYGHVERAGIRQIRKQHCQLRVKTLKPCLVCAGHYDSLRTRVSKSIGTSHNNALESRESEAVCSRHDDSIGAGHHNSVGSGHNDTLAASDCYTLSWDNADACEAHYGAG